jgi:hypothetical protein
MWSYRYPRPDRTLRVWTRRLPRTNLRANSCYSDRTPTAWNSILDKPESLARKPSSSLHTTNPQAVLEREKPIGTPGVCCKSSQVFRFGTISFRGEPRVPLHMRRVNRQLNVFSGHTCFHTFFGHHQVCGVVLEPVLAEF